MTRGIDFEQMEAALKRAAYKAVHGTREERAGRSLPVAKRDISRYDLHVGRVPDTDVGSRDK